jgi:hypothetical protein
MKALLPLGLSLTLGLVPATSFAQELNWRATGNAAPTTAAPPVTLSRPVPLDEPHGSPLLRAVVRGQNPDESKPLPPGPLSLNPGVPADVKGPAVPSFTFAQDPGKTMPRADGSPSPGSQLTMPLANGKTAPPVWGPPVSSDRLLGINGQCGDPCGNPCCTSCCDSCGSWCSGLFSHFHFFRHRDECCDPCGNSCGDLCFNGCVSRPCLWVYADYLLWAQKNQQLPPLVTTSPAGVPLVDPVTGAPVAGVLGQPGTAVAFDRFSNPARSGLRIGGGLWFGQDCCWGMDASYWFLNSSSRNFALSGDPGTQVFRPITLVGVGPTAEVVTSPQGFPTNGTVTVHETQEIWGVDLNLRRRVWCSQTCWLDLLVGYRHVTLREGLDIGENLVVFPPAGIQVNIVDRFATSNNFNAPQIGAAAQWYFAPRWSLFGSLRVATGINSESVSVAGFTSLGGVPFNAGILAAGTNSGTRTKERFAVMPELNLKVAYDITPNLSVYAGYDFLYISSVVRPDRQIDLTVNPSQIPRFSGTTALVGPANPAPLLRGESFWLQGVNFGLLYKY